MPIDGGKAFIADFTNTKDSSGFNPAHQKPGDYHGKVKDVESGKSSNGNDKVTFAIQDVDRPSAVYPYICTFTEASLWKLRNLMVAAGVTVPKKKVKLTAQMLNRLIGKEIGMSLEDDEYNGKIRSAIVQVFPASDLMDDDNTDVDDDVDDDDEVEDEPTPKRTAKKSAKKPPPPADDDEDEDLDEIDIDDL